MKCFVCGKKISSQNEHVRIPALRVEGAIYGSRELAATIRVCMDCYKSRTDSITTYTEN